MNKNINYYIFLALFAAAAIWFSKLISTSGSAALPLAIMLGIMLVFMTFVKTEWAIVILILSMLLSPEISVYGGLRKNVVIRVDDILIILVFFSWLVKMATNKELGVTVKNPLNKWLIGYTAVAGLSTGFAIMRGDIDPMLSFFFLLKYFQYYMLFFLIINNINTENNLKLYLFAGLATCIIVTLYAYSQMGTGDRLSAPFESPLGTPEEEIGGEPGTLGGYYLLIFGVIFGFLSEYSGKAVMWLSALILFLLVPFALTLSRASYLGFGVIAVSYLVLGKSKRIYFLLFSLLIGSIFGWYAVNIREQVTERIGQTLGGADAAGEILYFSRDTQVIRLGNREILIEPSTAARLHNYMRTATYWFPQRPFFGHGVTGVGLIDAQFPRVLGETGLIGFIMFIGIIVIIFRESNRIYKAIDVPLARALSKGVVFVLIGIIFQSLGANTFIIVRIMQPFWFLAACVMCLPYIYRKPNMLPADTENSKLI